MAASDSDFSFFSAKGNFPNIVDLTAAWPDSASGLFSPLSFSELASSLGEDSGIPDDVFCTVSMAVFITFETVLPVDVPSMAPACGVPADTDTSVSPLTEAITDVVLAVSTTL